MFNKRLYIIGALALAVIAAGCVTAKKGIESKADKASPSVNQGSNVQPTPDPTPAPQLVPIPTPVPTPPPADDSPEPVDSSVNQKSTYIPFNLTAYNQAREAKVPIYLYFYATWCPTCVVQEPIVRELFDSGDVPGGVRAFRVNYADSDTDDVEKTLANQLGVNYQHTMIMFNSQGQQVGKTLGHRTREQLLSDIQKGL